MDAVPCSGGGAAAAGTHDKFELDVVYPVGLTAVDSDEGCSW